MECTNLIFSRHAQIRMHERAISPSDVETAIRMGKVIIEDTARKPFPIADTLGTARDTAVHIVVARNPESLECIVVTVYYPDSDRWFLDRRSRRTR